jgi:transposase-like protein
MSVDVEEAVLEMYLQGVSTRRVSSITQAPSRVRVSKDAVSRITKKLDEEVQRWRERGIELAFPYLIVDACYLKTRWGDRVGDLALLVAVGIGEDGYREVLAVESAAGERKEAYRSMLKALLERGLTGVQLVVSDDHEAIKYAVATELPEAAWQRCVVHFERNVLSHVPAADMKVVAEDLKVVFKAKRLSTARALAVDFVEHYRSRFPKAVRVFEAGLGDALSFLAFPSSHQRLIRSTSMLERLFREVKRRTRVVGVFPSEGSAVNLVTAVLVRATEDWALRRYMDMAPLEAMNANPTQTDT